MRIRLVHALSLSAVVAIAVVASGCARDASVSPTSSESGLPRSGEVVTVGEREYLLTHQIKDAPGRDGFEILEVKVDVVDYAVGDTLPLEVELSATAGDGSPRVTPAGETEAYGASGSGAPPFWQSNRWNTRQSDPMSWATAEAPFTLREGETGVKVTAQSADGSKAVWLVR